MININVERKKLVKRLLFFNIGAIAFTLILGVFIILLFEDFVLPYILIMFSDFCQVMQFALSSNPYLPSIGASYPPLAIMILYPSALICRSIIHLTSLQMLTLPQFWISFLLFYCALLALAAPLIKKLTKLKGKAFALFFLAVLSTGTVLYTIARGNIILAALVFLLFFLVFYNSKNRFLRELALISLALSGVIKIYPLFFGILLLRDKKFFASVRVAVYTAVLFFVPFLFFDGGFSNIELFIENLGGFSLDSQRMLYAMNMSSTGLVYKLFYVFEKIFNVSLAPVSRIVSLIVIAAVVVVAITGALLSKNKLSVLVICGAVIALVPTVSYYYSAIFLLIPLLQYVADFENLAKGRKKFYLMFFMAVACITCFLFNCVLGMLFVGVLFYETLRNIKIYYKEKQKRIVLEV